MPDFARTLRILLVEDNPGDALLVEALLEDVPEFNFTLEHVSTAAEAVALLELEREHFDAILLDLSLPDAQGLESVQKVCPAAPRLPIVVMSGLNSERVATQALKEGAQDYLIKGEASGQVIARTLRYALERTRTAVELKAAQGRAEVLSALSDALQSARSPDEVVRRAVEQLGPALSATFMLALSMDGERVVRGAASGEVDPAVEAFFRNPARTLANSPVLEQAWGVQAGVYLFDSTAQGWGRPDFPALACGTEPILRVDGPVKLEGFLTAWRDQIWNPWTEGEKELMARAAATVALALERAALQQALEKRNAELERSTQEALGAANMTAWEWDLAAQRIRFSQPKVMDDGTRTHEVVPEQSLARIHPDDQDRYRLHIESLLAGADRSSVTVQAWSPEVGAYRWFEDNALARRDASGRLVVISGLTRDIHERREAELERDRLFAELEALLAELPVGVVMAEPGSGRLLVVNNQAEKLIRAPIRGVDSVSDYFGALYPDGTPMRREDYPMARAVQRGQYVQGLEVDFLRGDGTRMVMSINTGPVRGEGGEVRGVLFTFADVTERVQAERELDALLGDLQRERLQLEAILNELPVGVLLAEAGTGKIVLENRQSAEILGRSALGPLSVDEYSQAYGGLHPDGSPFTDADYPAYKAIMHGEFGRETEFNYRRPDGSVVILSVNTGPLRDPDGRLRGVVLVYRDITERRTASRRIEASEARFRLYADNLQDVLWICNPAERKLVYASSAFARIWGRPLEALRRSWDVWFESVHPEDRERVRQSFFRDVFAGKYDEEYRVVRPNGTVRWVRDRGFRLEGMGEMDGAAAGIAQDITERKLAELARVESESRLNLALGSSGVVFWEWDQARRKVFFDGRADELFGLAPGTVWLSSEAFEAHILDEDRATFEASIQEALASSELVTVDYRILRGKGTRWIQGRHKCIEKPGGERVINGVFLDITERKLVELRLRELNEVQKRFVSDAAHELRAPLTAIQGNLELVRLYTNMSFEDRLETVADAEREAARLGRLVSDLLTLARGDQGVQRVEDDLKLEDALEEAWRAAQPLGKAHQMVLGTLEPCLVMGDRDRLKQLALILLENALKYTPPNGTVALELKCLEREAEFRVLDSGPGIAESDLEKAEGRKQKAEGRRQKAEGRGLRAGGHSVARAWAMGASVD